VSELPAGWDEKPIGAIADFVRGVTYKKPQASAEPGPGLLPLLRATNIDGNSLRLDTDLVHVPSDLVKPEQRLRQGDVVVATSSGSVSVVGKSGRLANSWDGTFGAFCGVLRSRGQVMAEYLSHYVQSDLVRRSWSDAAQGTNINNLKPRDMVATRIPIAPPGEQQRIVDAIEEQFSRLDAGVESLQRAKRNLDLLRASGLAAVFDEQMSSWQHHGEGSGEHEPLARLEDFATDEARAITDGPFGSNLKTSHYTDAGPRVIRLQNIGDGVFVDERAHISETHFEALQGHTAEAGDVVIASLGGELPRACVVPDWLGPAIVKADCIRLRPAQGVDARYVVHMLGAPQTRRAVKDLVHGVGRPRLGLKAIRAIELPKPPLAEQQRVVNVLDAEISLIDAISDAINAAVERADALRQAILASAFGGDLLVASRIEVSGLSATVREGL